MYITKSKSNLIINPKKEISKISTIQRETIPVVDFLRPNQTNIFQPGTRKKNEQNNAIETPIIQNKTNHTGFPVQLKKVNVIQLYPTTAERTKDAKVGDRHHIPNPFFDLGGWYKTLMFERIHDLFLTKEGFRGHAQQVDQELRRLIAVIPKMEREALQTVEDYQNDIQNFIIERAQMCTFDFEPFVFHFSGNREMNICKKNNEIILNRA